MFLDGSNDFINPQEVFLPSLDELDFVEVQGDGSRVLRVQG